MTDRKPDFTRFTLRELYDARNTLDRNQHPGQIAEVELLIRDRERQQKRHRWRQRISLADRKGRIASVKPGRAASLGGGVLQILVGILFGWFWVSFNVGSLVGLGGPILAIGLLGAAAAVISGAYNLYNALARNRFSDQDFVAPGAEPDPLSRSLGYENDRDTNAQ